MASKLFLPYLRQNIPIYTRRMSAHVAIPDKIGNRDVVGCGYNGEASYMDRLDFPLPAIRFKANTPDVMALREKEKGDWKKLSIEEKKTIYRNSFRQTLAEIQAPTGEWKGEVGVTLMGVALSIWILMFLKIYGVGKNVVQSARADAILLAQFYARNHSLASYTMILRTSSYPPLPVTFDEEHRLAQMERMKLLDVNPISGISSKYFK